MPLINCEVSLILTWPSTCVITNYTGQGKFEITDTNLYVPAVTLSTQDNAELLEQRKSGFKRVVNWNNHLSRPELLVKNPNLNHLVVPSFQGVNRLFVLAFENDADRASHNTYYLPNIEIKDYNIMINGKNVFDQSIKDNKVTYENIRKIAVGRGDDYTTGCLLDYPYFRDNYKMIAVDLSKQQALDADPRAIQQINLTANLEEDNTRIFFVLEEEKETILKFARHCKSIANMLCNNLVSYKMTQNNSLNVKLSNSQLNKLKSAIKNETDVILRLSSNMIGNSDDEANFPHKLLLTKRQVANICKAFANHTSTHIKLSKTQLTKMQKGGFLRFLAPLLNFGLPLLKYVIKPLCMLGLTTAASATDAAINKKILVSGNHTTLIISNDDMHDFLKIVKSLEDSGILLDGITETVKNEVKEQKGGFLSMFLGTLGAFLLGNLLTKNLSDRGVIRAGEGTISAGYGSKKF